MAMMILSDSVLVESKSARDNQLARLSHESALEIINRAKGLLVALWQGTGVTTTEEIARYYEVESSVVRHASKQHRDELLSDGWREVKGKEELKVLRSIGCEVFSLPEATTRVAIWTPRAALRLGMLLRNSAIAQAVRTSLLDAVEQVLPAQSNRIRELELELELAHAQASAAQSQERLIQVSSAIVTMHGAGMLGLILGKPEAIIEQPPIVVEKNILVNQAGRPIKTYEGLSKTKLAKRYGMKKPQDLVNWLQSMGRADLIQPGITTAPCQFVPFEFVPELDRLWAARQGDRQRLLGE
jgi:hypothetical protein